MAKAHAKREYHREEKNAGQTKSGDLGLQEKVQRKDGGTVHLTEV